MYLYPDAGWKEYVTYMNEDQNKKTDTFSSVHCADLGENGKYSIYLDEDQLFMDTRLIGVHSVSPVDWKSSKTKISGFSGDYIYSIQYTDNLLSRLTYLMDIDRQTEYDGWGFDDIWLESWDYQRIELKKEHF